MLRLLFIYFQFWDEVQNSIPKIWQVVFSQNITINNKHLTSVLIINNIIDMNIWKKFYMGKHFPSDLRKLPRCTAKAFLQEKIFSVFESPLTLFHHINNTQQIVKVT